MIKSDKQLLDFQKLFYFISPSEANGIAWRYKNLF